MSDFIVESREHLVQIESQVLTLEREPTDCEALNAVFRGFHTIKGLAGFHGTVGGPETGARSGNRPRSCSQFGNGPSTPRASMSFWKAPTTCAAGWALWRRFSTMRFRRHRHATRRCCHGSRSSGRNREWPNPPRWLPWRQPYREFEAPAADRSTGRRQRGRDGERRKDGDSEPAHQPPAQPSRTGARRRWRSKSIPPSWTIWSTWREKW